jgi:predicted nucleic acid-binding protein
MNGSKFLLDTNALVGFFQGKESLLHLLKNATNISVSVITKIEYLSYPKLLEQDVILMEQFLKDCIVFDLASGDLSLINQIIKLRMNYGLKLPDAIIASQALINDYVLISSDKDFEKILELKTINFI